jgi:hypothetical protein
MQALLLCASVAQAERIDLSGTWKLALDRGSGDTPPALTESIRLPGLLQAQGFGDEVSTATKWVGGVADRSWYTAPQYAPYREPGNVKIPFWLQPERHYAGVAWCQREIEIPAAWKGRRVVLTLERPHWETRVWLDDRMIGTNDSLSTPHVYDLGVDLPAGPHRLTIRVDNRMVVDVGENSHSVTDHTQGNWNGIVGEISLSSTPPVWIDDVQIYPDAAKKTARVKVRIGNATGEEGRGRVQGSGFRVQDRKELAKIDVPVSWASTGGEATFEIKLPPTAGTWDEFTPELLALSLSLETEPRTLNPEPFLTRFAFRDLATRGTQFTLNGHPIFLRGTLECAIFPKEGHPPTDVESWRRIVRICKAHGLNHIRFHSWCPPEAAFVAADEEGFYYQVEAASWANQSTTIGDGKPIDAWIYAETDRILQAYGNHPSFLLMPYGNEPGGGKHGAFLGKWVEHCKEKDPRHLYTTAAGWPERPENQYHNVPQPRVQGWGQGLGSRINARAGETTTDYRGFVEKRTVPVVSHEIGQWCVYPDFDEIGKYTGYLKPKNFEIFRDFLNARGMGDQARAFLMASGFQQVLCYKEEIESALRTPGFGGFQLLDLHDFPGQGTALVGVLDPFWNSKPYCTPEQFRRFCGPTVPLARMSRRTWSAGETFAADIEISHFGKVPMVGKTVTWKFQSLESGIEAKGSFADVMLEFGTLQRVGRVEVPLTQVKRAAMAKLTVRIDDHENDWDVWVNPAAAAAPAPAGVTVAATLDEALPALRAGGRVLLAAPARTVKSDVALGFSSVFWNTAWTGGQPPHTLGMVVRNRHPALADFPTEDHSNWQWWDLIHGGAAMVLDDLPREVQPIVQPIDTWFRAHKLALLFEARVAGGRLLVCSLDLTGDSPEARQMKRSLLDYVAGPKFEPAVELTPDQLAALFRPHSGLARLGAKVSASGAEPGYEAEKVMDGDPDTIWHTRYSPAEEPFPHHLTIDLGATRSVRGLRYLPRQDMSNGRIAEFELLLSADGKTWSAPVAAGRWPDSSTWQEAKFAAQSARFLRLTGKAEVAGRAFASAAEIEVVCE